MECTWYSETHISKIRIVLSVFFVLISCMPVKADGVSFTISKGIDDLDLRGKIEDKVMKLLNEVNAACMDNRAIDFVKIEVDERVQQSMTMLWEYSHFMCPDDDIVEPCNITDKGYQIRHIPLVMKSIDKEGENDYQEAVINFDKQGNIESFYLSVPANLSGRIVRTDLDSTDLKHRGHILDFIEQLRTAYNQKDIKFIEHVFEDDGIVEIKSQKELKEKYLRNLQKAFLKNDNVKVTFEDIEVMRHPENPNFYGVTLLQGWTSGKYHDDGYLFLLWDFTNENAPQIHVRTWQPDKIGDKPLPKDEVFSLSDFDI